MRTGPFDGWPLGRGFDRFYGFMDAETDQYAPELVIDNSSIDPPGSFESGYHLTADLVDRSIRFLADHAAEQPDAPWLLWLAPGACHAPHQAPFELIKGYDDISGRLGRGARSPARPAEGNGRRARDRRGCRPRNPGVQPWGSHHADEQRVFTRLQSAYAAMLDHADRHLARLVEFLAQTSMLANTIVLVTSDNGASQEGGPFGFVNSLGPRNLRDESFTEKLARLDEIGGPKTHSNFPLGWAMAANTPLRRYKQNTHGGGVRVPLVVSWPERISSRGELRQQFAHACDLVPTLLDLLRVEPPAQINGVTQMPIEGTSFAASIYDPTAPSKTRPQYFEMFGHRGLWHEGWKAVAFHSPGTPYDTDQWELFQLSEDFSETNDLAASRAEKLCTLVKLWWDEAAKHKVLPLDDRFRERFVANADRVHATRKCYVFHAGMGHLPTEVAPDVRSRSYLIEADVHIGEADDGVLIAHGDAASGYSLYLQGGHLVHDMNIGGEHVIVRSQGSVLPGGRRLGVRVRREVQTTPPTSECTLLIDGIPAGHIQSQLGVRQLRLLERPRYRTRSWFAGLPLPEPVHVHRQAHQGDRHDGRPPGVGWRRRQSPARPGISSAAKKRYRQDFAFGSKRVLLSRVRMSPFVRSGHRSGMPRVVIILATPPGGGVLSGAHSRHGPRRPRAGDRGSFASVALGHPAQPDRRCCRQTHSSPIFRYSRTHCLVLAGGRLLNAASGPALAHAPRHGGLTTGRLTGRDEGRPVPPSLLRLSSATVDFGGRTSRLWWSDEPRGKAIYSAGNTTSTPFFFRRITMNFAGSVVLALRPTVCTSLGPS